MNIQLLNTLPGAIGYKDKYSVYIAGNQQLASYMGYEHAEKITGLTDANTKSEMSALASQFVEQDKEVMQTGERQHIDIGYYPNGDLQIHFSVKKQLRDNNNKTIGTVFTCFELQPTFLSHLYQDLMIETKPSLFTIGGHYDDYHLTKRESECLFYLIRGWTAKTIAKKLNLSNKTIECYIDRIKNKLDCPNKSSLIEKSIQLGFIFNIPISIFPGSTNH